MKPLVLPISEAGGALGGLSRATIYRLIGRGELEAVKIGTRTLVTVASIELCAANASRLGG